MKKILLAVAMAFSILPAMAQIPETLTGSCGENLTWTLTVDGVFTIEGSGAMNDVIVDEFETITNRPWLYYSAYINTIVLPDGLTTIGDKAFISCTNLTSITFPEGLTHIGNNAFDACIGLTSITLPEGLTSIGDAAFFSCIELSSITFPNGLTSIGDDAFNTCFELTSINLPDGLTSIGDGAFMDCWKLSSITFSDNLISIGERAFSSCYGLTTLNFPDKLRSIGKDAFSSCTHLSDISLPESLSYLSGFSGCSSLIEITLPENLDTIGENAFSGCIGLPEISIPQNVKHIGSRAFRGCINLLKVTNKRPVPQDIDISVFEDVPKLGLIKLIVPAGAQNSYQEHKYWKLFDIEEENSFLVSVTSNNKLYGSTKGSGLYASGSSVRIEAKPALGYKFVKWNDNNTENPRMITVTEDTSFTALFEKEPELFALTVTANAASYGTVEGEGLYAYGTSAIMKASPASGYVFVKWNDEISDNPRQVTVTADTSFIAVFDKEPEIFTLTVVANNVSYGTVEGGGDYASGSSAILKATANESYMFVKWDDGNTDNPRTLMVTEDATYTAIFKKDVSTAYTIDIKANNDDWGTVNSEVVIRAAANEGYKFVKWDDDNTDNPRTLAVTEDISLTAIFEELLTNETESLASVMVYPNPSNGLFIVESNIAATAEIHACNGLVLKRLEWNEGKHEVDLSGYPAGIYYLRIQNHDSFQTIKLVVK